MSILAAALIGAIIAVISNQEIQADRIKELESKLKNQETKVIEIKTVETKTSK